MSPIRANMNPIRDPIAPLSFAAYTLRVQRAQTRMQELVTQS